MPDNDTGPLQSDPPILIGGGGSTLIWIRKDQNARKVPLARCPVPLRKPAHPELYDSLCPRRLCLLSCEGS
jgi:hypothetical protein